MIQLSTECQMKIIVMVFHVDDGNNSNNETKMNNIQNTQNGNDNSKPYKLLCIIYFCRQQTDKYSNNHDAKASTCNEIKPTSLLTHFIFIYISFAHALKCICILYSCVFPSYRFENAIRDFETDTKLQQKKKKTVATKRDTRSERNMRKGTLQ